MSLIRDFRRARVKNQTTTTRSFDNYTTLPEFFHRRGTVSRDRAMRITTVWACIKIRAETIGALPVDVVEYDGPSRKQQDPPPWLQRPNPEMTRFELFERTSASIDADGNAYWLLERDNLGRLREVWVIPPTAVAPYRVPLDSRSYEPGEKRYKIDGDDYGPDRILHIPGFTLPGQLRGMSPIEQHAHALGLAASAEEYGEAFFDNGAVMSGIIEVPGEMSKPDADRMRDTFTRDHSRRRAHKPGVLFGGAKWSQLTIPNDNAQFLETRKFQRSEICSIFRVPPHKVGDLERATFSNIEQQGIEWVTDGVMPTTTRIESAILAAGLLDEGQHLKFNLAGLMRGDTPSRFAAYAVGRQWGWLSADDIRAFEDQNPLPDGVGATYLEPLNMVPAGHRPEIGSRVDPGAVEAIGALVRAGFVPASALEALGLPPIHHEGNLPVTVQGD